MKFHKDILKIDCGAEVDRICSFIQQQIIEMKRGGVVLGLSGGIDSALSAELCLRAVGREKVLGLLLPEKESNPIASEYASLHAQKLGLNTVTIDITPTLEGFGTFRKRDEAIRTVFPEYDSRYKSKIVLPADLLARDAFNFYKLIIKSGDGKIKTSRLDNERIRNIVAATNTKQRTRMMHLYYYAEMNNYLVCGTTNRSELIQGFFVKHGDGGVDIEPIAHLYKTQIYQLSDHLGVLEEIVERPPSPDTFSLEVTDEEMYFRIPYKTLDLLLYAWTHNIAIPKVCKTMALTAGQVKRVFRDFTSKYNATEHSRILPPTLDLIVLKTHH